MGPQRGGTAAVLEEDGAPRTSAAFGAAAADQRGRAGVLPVYIRALFAMAFQLVCCCRGPYSCPSTRCLFWVPVPHHGQVILGGPPPQFPRRRVGAASVVAGQETPFLHSASLTRSLVLVPNGTCALHAGCIADQRRRSVPRLKQSQPLIRPSLSSRTSFSPSSPGGPLSRP